MKVGATKLHISEVAVVQESIRYISHENII